ncbi:MAG: XapX domain-containing protein [Halobacteriales archaeon]|jgi:XapX domain-containing protein
MVERSDPGRAGVKAGRIVGLLTAALAVVSLLQVQDSFYEGVTLLLDTFGMDSGPWLAVVFWGNVLFAAMARYAIGYVVGSLVGVLYDWLDRPSLPVLVGVVFVVGIVDGVLALLDTLSVAIGGAYVFAWLCYVPAFVWLFDDDGERRSGPVRLGEL